MEETDNVMDPGEKISEMNSKDTGNNEPADQPAESSETEKLYFAVGRTRGTRIMAWILLGLIFLIFVGFIICLVTGSPYLYAMLFLLIFVPVFFYLMLWIKKVFGK